MQKIDEIKIALQQCDMAQLPQLLQAYQKDERKGVQKLVQTYQKRYTAHLQELQRLQNILQYERQCYAKGYTLVAGVDEVGRGPLAGPVVAAAVILPQNHIIAGIDDSKKLTAKKEKNFVPLSKKRRLRGLWVWFHTHALMKSIFYRQHMKQCEKRWQILQYPHNTYWQMP